MPDDFLKITLRRSVYEHLLIRLDRVVSREDNDADHNWLREFASNLRWAEDEN